MPYFPLALIRNIRATRKKAGYTQEKIAEELGISVLSYGKLERGCQPISLERLAKIADILDTTVYDLLEGSVPGALPAAPCPSLFGEMPRRAERAQKKRRPSRIVSFFAMDYMP